MLRSEFVALWTRPLWKLTPAISEKPSGPDDLSFRFEPMTIQACYGTIRPVRSYGLSDFERAAP